MSFILLFTQTELLMGGGWFHSGHLVTPLNFEFLMIPPSHAERYTQKLLTTLRSFFYFFLSVKSLFSEAGLEWMMSKLGACICQTFLICVRIRATFK